ncbi:hypothetical protein BCV70DRAFT_63408 [Testicularia cyperi]|uniref:Uncharacterized protein n=1 Tax=Testicularia cyperi TaxID=1882483 RepID=A0A317XW94_9BASI|nr:hypothetical protein BCV70DRAFT_63408 [Testicularia cyperi]
MACGILTAPCFITQAQHLLLPLVTPSTDQPHRFPLFYLSCFLTVLLHLVVLPPASPLPRCPQSVVCYASVSSSLAGANPVGQSRTSAALVPLCRTWRRRVYAPLASTVSTSTRAYTLVCRSASTSRDCTPNDIHSAGVHRQNIVCSRSRFLTWLVPVLSASITASFETTRPALPSSSAPPICLVIVGSSPSSRPPRLSSSSALACLDTLPSSFPSFTTACNALLRNDTGSLRVCHTLRSF